MDENIRTALDQTPDRAPRSKLEPHADLIRQLRRKGRTYQDIAQFFAEHLNIKVAPSTIHAFVRVRALRRNALPIELPPTTATRVTPIATTDLAVKARIEALKRRRVPKPTQVGRFEYDENEPLELLRERSQGKKGA